MVFLRSLARGLLLVALMTSAFALLSRVSTRAPDLTRELVESAGGSARCGTSQGSLETVKISEC